MRWSGSGRELEEVVVSQTGGQGIGRRAWTIAVLLFGSGLCALMYQVVWMREFRLLFGVSTASTAAVVAIFVGGLGLGGLVLGLRADRQANPLLFYAGLEMGVALFAALTPQLLWVVRQLYFGLGGSVKMGIFAATVVRLLGSMLVLLGPTFLMGGTLPAAARAAQTETDAGRRTVSLLYGLNTLGAVLGCLLANFVLLEVLGALRTLWVACLLNLLVVVMARHLAQGDRETTADAAAAREPKELDEEPCAAVASQVVEEASVAPACFVLMAACVVGFGFFLMELVWYRMLGPILGGTIFTFGLILAVALLGIGLGGVVYALVGQRKPATLLGFSFTCLLEAVCVALPYALGDRLAVWAIVLRPLGVLGFAGFVFGWALVAAVAVLPAAFVAGVQFPMLIALLGRGRRAVGRQIGLAYAWNTVGAIAGALAGGFGLIPLLTAPGCWKMVAGLLLSLGVLALILAAFKGVPWRRLAWPVVLGAVVVMLLFASGPTAAWRHSPIGVGHVSVASIDNPNRLRDWLNGSRSTILSETDGVESSLAIQTYDGLAFVLNGKIDGNARGDAATQVMGGVLPAALHPAVRHAMVIGLGTGSTAGWLGAVPGMESVDVVELEPAILDVARRCALVNKDVLNNPKVRVFIGDAREVLQTTPQRYDLIFSEPSNPYRAGIASLYSQEFYRSVSKRLVARGIFVQWVQAYEIDAQTVRTVMATLRSVFPYVETWTGEVSDLLLLASNEPIPHDIKLLRERLEQAPYAEALRKIWRVAGVEGLFSHFIAGPGLTNAVAAKEKDWLNTDDCNLVEFGFARKVGDQYSFSTRQVLETARQRGEHRIAAMESELDWNRVEELRLGRSLLPDNLALLDLGPKGEDIRHRLKAQSAYQRGDLVQALAEWRSQSGEPVTPQELALVSEALAVSGDEAALNYLAPLALFQPTEADLIRAELYTAERRNGEALAALQEGLVRLRQDPWPARAIVMRALALALLLARNDQAAVNQLNEALRQPFAAYVADFRRREVRWQIATRAQLTNECVEVVGDFEPHVPWTLDFLRFRRSCYQAYHHPLEVRAASDLQEYVAKAPLEFSAGLAAAAEQ
jgi:spermidine synthase